MAGQPGEEKLSTSPVAEKPAANPPPKPAAPPATVTTAVVFTPTPEDPDPDDPDEPPEPDVLPRTGSIFSGKSKLPNPRNPPPVPPPGGPFGPGGGLIALMSCSVKPLCAFFPNGPLWVILNLPSGVIS